MKKLIYTKEGDFLSIQMTQEIFFRAITHIKWLARGMNCYGTQPFGYKQFFENKLKETK